MMECKLFSLRTINNFFKILWITSSSLCAAVYFNDESFMVLSSQKYKKWFTITNYFINSFSLYQNLEIH